MVSQCSVGHMHSQLWTIGCSHGDIRLESGDALLNSNGPVQVCYGNVWKSICRNGAWSREEANVVCSQLGYSNQGTCFIEL